MMAFLQIIMVIFPLVIAAVGIWTLVRNKRASPLIKATWEWPTTMLGFMLEMIVINLLVSDYSLKLAFENQVQELHNDLREYKLEVSKLRITPDVQTIDLSDQQSYQRTIESRIEPRIRDENLLVRRVFFRPLGVPGSLNNEDGVLGRQFGSIPFQLTYLIGFPDSQSVLVDPDLKIRRDRMLPYLFSLLTEKTTQTPAYNEKVEFLYLPFSAPNDTYEIRSGSHHECGSVFFQGRWTPEGNTPIASLLEIRLHEVVNNSMSEQHDSLISLGRRFLQQQLEIEPYLRDPVAIFCDAPHLRLRPCSVESIEEKCRLWEALAQQDGASKRPTNISVILGIISEIRKFEH